MDNYEIVKVKQIPDAKLKKLAKTGRISFTAADLMGNLQMFLHPMNAKIIKKAQKDQKGINGLKMTGGEINYNMIHGGGIWDVLKTIGSTIYKAVTSDTGKKVLGAVADAGVPYLTNKIGLPEDAGPVARSLVKNITGVGLDKRLVNLAKARAAKKTKGGSFKI